MGSCPHLWFCACKTATLGPELQVSVGPRYDLSLCASTTAYLASDLLFSMGPRHHLWYLIAIQQLLE